MAVGDVWKLTPIVTLFGQNIRTGFHFESNTATQGPLELVDHWHTGVAPVLVARQSVDCVLSGYRVEQKVPGTAASVETVVEPPLAGFLQEPALPPADAVVFSLKSALKSPRSRGRMYWVGATEPNSAAGQLTAPGLVQWQEVAAAIAAIFLGASPTSGWKLCVYSPEALVHADGTPVTPPRPGTIVTPVSAIIVDQILRTQRRRQIGHGQ